MVAPARAAAFWALQHITSGDTTLGDALARARGRVEDDRDRALINEIVAGTLRHRAALDHQLSSRIARRYAGLDEDVRTALRMAAFQLLHLTRVPASAVVNDAVTLVRNAGIGSASGLVNAVLRRLARERGDLSWPPRPASLDTAEDQAAMVAHLATRYSHPAWLVERWLRRHGVESTEQWLAFDNDPPPLMLAVNTTRTPRAQLRDALAAEGVTVEPAAIAPRGLVVRGGSALSSAAFRDGLCLVQDEASQLVADIVPVAIGGRVLDACASPGGKTIALAAAAGAAGQVIATDIRARRMRTLRETLTRCRTTNVEMVQIAADGALPFAADSFDTVLVDAPCSGLGTLRRDPDIRWRRGEEELQRMAAAQLDILSRVAPLVRPGGVLVYSTCSSEPDENDAVVQRFLTATPAFSPRPPQLAGGTRPLDAMITAEGYLRTLPFRDGLEAFFAAILQRAPAA